MTQDASVARTVAERFKVLAHADLETPFDPCWLASMHRVVERITEHVGMPYISASDDSELALEWDLGPWSILVEIAPPTYTANMIASHLHQPISLNLCEGESLVTCHDLNTLADAVSAFVRQYLQPT